MQQSNDSNLQRFQGAWREIALAGKAVACYHWPDGSAPRGVLLFLHDADGTTLESSSTFSALLERHRLVCVCPRSGGSWWLDRVWQPFDPQVSPERWLTEHLMPWIQARWHVPTSRLGVFGIGAGGQGALRLAFRHSGLFQTVAGINAILDFHDLYHSGTALDEMYDSKEQCRQDTAILQIHPAQYPAHMFFCYDPASHWIVRGNDRLHEKLGALGIPHEIDFSTTANGGGEGYVDRIAERVVQFLARGIEETSRRLL